MSQKHTKYDCSAEVEQFAEMLTSEVGASTNTIAAYTSDLYDFIGFLGQNNLELLSVHQTNIEQYLQNLAQQGLTDRTQARRLSALRMFFTFLVREKKIAGHPAKLIGRPKQGRRLPKFLSEAEITALINAAYHSEHPDQLRRVVFIELLYATGMRISELLRIRLSDIVWQEECILIVGKGNKQRLVPFNQSTKQALIHYIQGCIPPLKDWLFPSSVMKAPLTRQRFFQIIKELALEADIDPSKVSPHVIRHAFATHLLNHGANLMNVQKLLGHTDISATEIYTHVMTEKLKDTVFNHHPLATRTAKR